MEFDCTPQNVGFFSILSLKHAINQEGFIFVEKRAPNTPSEFDALQFGV